jgi:hypothetical protein
LPLESVASTIISAKSLKLTTPTFCTFSNFCRNFTSVIFIHHRSFFPKMSQHSSLRWSEWEEDNLLPWLDAKRALSWEARAAAYNEQYETNRTVESLRGKKYHILRKRRLNRAKVSRQRSVPKRQKRVRRLGGARKRFPAFTDTKAQKIDHWLQRIPSPESTTSENSFAMEKSHSGTQPFSLLALLANLICHSLHYTSSA